MEGKTINIFDLLKEYGIDIEILKQRTKESFDKEFENEYTKLDNQAKERINAIFQFLPGIMTDAVVKNESTEKSKKILEGAYRVVIPDGMHLAKSKATDGAFRGSLLSDMNNQVSGQAELLKMDGQISFSKIPNLALGIFDTLSYVTGQYYLSEINGKLTGIERKTESILKYLENQTKSELWADNQELDEAFENVEYISHNLEQRMAYLSLVKDIKRSALQKIKFFDTSIADERQNLSLKSKPDELLSITEKMAHLYLEYWYALFLFAKATVCEIVLGGITDPNAISSLKEKIIDYCRLYKTAYAKDEKQIREIIDHSKALNQRFKLPVIRDCGDVSEPVLALMVVAYDAAAIATNVSADKKKENKSIVKKHYDDMIKCFNNTPVLDGIVQGINDYAERVTCPVEVIHYNGETYVKFDVT